MGAYHEDNSENVAWPKQRISNGEILKVRKEIEEMYINGTVRHTLESKFELVENKKQKYVFRR